MLSYLWRQNIIYTPVSIVLADKNTLFISTQNILLLSHSNNLALKIVHENQNMN